MPVQCNGIYRKKRRARCLCSTNRLSSFIEFMIFERIAHDFTCGQRKLTFDRYA